ncbi:endonuclease domain-containing protein [Caulobacter sp. S45]|uniref:endonuclease domain-containing protein n=1 Tax=Caulobacter sp. S45 TaxID=1641861 RepID=UPI0015770760|nr:endonuclease domain-containing protein [Caulobacter sp. S45]
MSLPEVLLWIALRKRQAGLRFRRQHPIGPYILDFYCEAARLAVEIDGDGHLHGDQLLRDARRDRWVAAQGVSTLRVAARDVLGGPDDVVATIRSAAADRDHLIALGASVPGEVGSSGEPGYDDPCTPS